MLTYSEALEFIYSLSNMEAAGSRAAEHFDLSRMTRILARMGHPDREYQTIHVAGTKGKGSVSAMLESILRAAGHRTGFYLSPHLHTFRERVRISGQYIREAEVASWIDRIRPLIAAVPGTSTFETITALALGHFAQKGVDIAVLEVGLGGRLDATNVVTPLVSVITSVSYDHMAVLGNTLSEIAYEKAGIIKQGVPVVSAPQPAEALGTIRSVAQERKAPLTLVGQDWSWKSVQSDLDGQVFSLSREGAVSTPYSRLTIPLLGIHQLINASTTVATVDVLREAGVAISDRAVREGLQSVRWPGRLEILSRRPVVVVDGAHNGDSCRRLKEALQHYFDYRRMILIFGASVDKDHSGMLEALRGLNPALVIMSRASHPRAMAPAALRAMAQSLGIECVMIPCTGDALDHALSEAGNDDLVCACGSLFIAAETREAWMKRGGGPLPPTDPVDM